MLPSIIMYSNLNLFISTIPKYQLIKYILFIDIFTYINRFILHILYPPKCTSADLSKIIFKLNFD